LSQHDDDTRREREAMNVVGRLVELTDDQRASRLHALCHGDAARLGAAAPGDDRG
jgi:hypothetical protein